jgi:hypothetical protein
MDFCWGECTRNSASQTSWEVRRKREKEGKEMKKGTRNCGNTDGMTKIHRKT